MSDDIIKNNVSCETYNKLENYVNLLLQWNKSINLISSTTTNDIWIRHIIDSYQLTSYIPQTGVRILDIGSGAGLPGLILSITNPEIEFILVESDKRKAIFLENTAQHLCLKNVIIINNRVENIQYINADIIVSRACAALNQLLDYSKMHLKQEGICLFLKGKNIHQEIQLANKHKFSYSLYESLTSCEAWIIKITGLI